MRNPLNKKMRGYQKAPRERFKLLKDKDYDHEWHELKPIFTT